jgi:serine/threonine-protein kinase
MTEITERLRGAIADRYTIERELGQGGMATVYLAHDVRHDRKVALKVLRPELAAIVGAERFLQEIRTTANLQHPHILPLHDSGEADGTVFYVMPYVEGESLRGRLARERQLPIDEAVRIAREVADALEYAHGHGVIHRDIKPENILLQGGHALVADFGIALAVSRSEGGTRMTETGMSLGTPHYMSPEQAMGEREITARSDVYAVGCVLYEMLAGEPPFSGPTAQAIVARVLTEEPRSLTLQRRTIPPHVETAVLTALAKLPADRFQHAADFAEALIKPATITAAAATATAPAARAPARRSGAVTALAALTALSAVIAAWGWLRPAGRRPTTWQYVSLGDSVTLVTDYPAMALSPDGSMLVFKDNRQNGLLWVKRRDQLDPVPIPGTERAQNPAFSPDGEWVAFVADGRLKKVRPSGGATVTIADSAAVGYGGAAWLDDGTLLYAVPSLGRLHRVNASGGASVPAWQGAPFGGGGVGMPVPLPDSRGALFQNCSSGCVNMAIHAVDLHTGKQKLLLDDVAQAGYLAGGHLVFVRRDGVAMAAPFDLDRFEITGEAVPVLEGVDVRALGGFALIAWSASGSLVYVRGSGAANSQAVVRVSRTGVAVPVDTAWSGAFNSVAVSRDGRRLAVGMGVGNSLNIWTKPFDRGPATRLTFGNRDRRPAWSADGRFVAFIRDSANGSAVHVRDADGGAADRQVARLDRMAQEVAWAPDGQSIVVRTDNQAAGAGDLVAVTIGRNSAVVPVAASEFTELYPAVSPDGRWLAYSSNESGQNEVYVRPFPGAHAVRWQVSNGGGTSPVWSTDGRALYYLDAGSQLVAAGIQPGASFTVTGLSTLFDASRFVIDGFHQSFAVTPAGEFLFLSPRGLALNNRNVRIVWVDNWIDDVKQRLRR